MVAVVISPAIDRPRCRRDTIFTPERHTAIKMFKILILQSTQLSTLHGVFKVLRIVKESPCCTVLDF